MIPFAILVGVLVGLLCDRLMLAHSASLRDKKSMKDYATFQGRRISAREYDELLS